MPVHIIQKTSIIPRTKAMTVSVVTYRQYNSFTRFIFAENL